MESQTTNLSIERKRGALERVLQSQTFARSDQLRNFLRYVCEMEMAGRGASINEYLIGVEALGRPEGYSPGEDSSAEKRLPAATHRVRPLVFAFAAGGAFCFAGGHFGMAVASTPEQTS